MNAFERVQCLIHGGTPDKPVIMAATGLRKGSQGGLYRRLVRRGLCLRHIVSPHLPHFSFPGDVNPYLEGVVYKKKYYHEDGNWSIKHTFITPVGEVYAIVKRNLDIDVMSDSPQTPFVKEPSDWRIINYIFQQMIDEMRPNYEEMKRNQDELGENGYTIAFIDKTPYQRAWIELASLLRTAIDCKEETEEFLEYLEVQKLYHEKVAEIAADCPSDLLLINDNVTNIISPKYYREFCIPYYQIYQDALQGTDKVLAVHHDGLIRDLKEAIQAAPFKVIDSLTVPPSGNVSLPEVKAWWPEKIPFVNLPPHLAFKEGEDLRNEYAELLNEWDSEQIAFVHVEDFPLDQVEEHLTTLLDVCGY